MIAFTEKNLHQHFILGIFFYNNNGRIVFLYNMKKVHEKSAAWRKLGMKRVQHKNTAWK